MHIVFLCEFQWDSSVAMEIHVWTLETARRNTLLKWQIRIWSYAHHYDVRQSSAALVKTVQRNRNCDSAGFAVGKNVWQQHLHIHIG